MHENYKASKTGQEKETKDASSIVNVNWYQVLVFGLFQLCINTTLYSIIFESSSIMSWILM